MAENEIKQNEFLENFERNPFDFPVSEIWGNHYQKVQDEIKLEFLKNEFLKILAELYDVKADVVALKQKMGRLGCKCCGSGPSIIRGPGKISQFLNGTSKKESSNDNAHCGELSSENQEA